MIRVYLLIRLIAGAENSLQINNLSYFNNGTEEGRGLVLLISNIPTLFFSSVSIAATVSNCTYVVHRVERTCHCLSFLFLAG